MDRYSKIVFGILVLFIAFSVAATYYRVFIKENYVISVGVSCNPSTESCFIEELEDGEVSYYKTIKKKAADIPFCDPHQTDCPEVSCETENAGCQIIYCDPDVGEVCSEKPTIEPLVEPGATSTEIDVELTTNTANEEL